MTTQNNVDNNIRILLADDNSINRKVSQGLLKKVGYRVDAVVNGLEAVTALEMINYDLVLMNLSMPKMGGLEATAIIRNVASKVLNHKVTIIAMTASNMQGDREKCLVAGMDGYLSIPPHKSEMVDILANWLEEKSSLPQE